MALILVLFIVALSSVLVVNFTYTANLEARSHLQTQRSLEAEYLLKSALNFARALIYSDATPRVDAMQDAWAFFANGAQVPAQFLDIQNPGVSVGLEIRPEDSKIPIRDVVSEPKRRPMLVALFRELGFDEDGEQDQTGLMPGRVMNSIDLVAALIDYMDPDGESFREGEYNGIESELPKDHFPNKQILRLGELASIPGFTPNRLRKLTPFIRTRGRYRININLAPKVVLRSIEEDLTADEMTESEVQAIIDYRSGEGDGPFGENSANLRQELSDLIGQDLADKIYWTFASDSTYFQVIAKIDYGNAAYFMRAYLSQEGEKEIPAIESLEFY